MLVIHLIFDLEIFHNLDHQSNLYRCEDVFLRKFVFFLIRTKSKLITISFYAKFTNVLISICNLQFNHYECLQMSHQCVV